MLSPYILVLSPFPTFLETFRSCLTRRCDGDWDVRIATHPGALDSLPSDVREPMVLAIVELRLEDPADKEDDAGLRLARRIKAKHGVPVVLMACEMPDNGLVDDWKRAGDIDEFLLIRSRYDKRWSHIDKILKTHLQINKDLQTPYDDRPGEWQNMMKKTRPSSSAKPQPSFSAADLAHLFHRLFPPDVERLDLQDLPGGIGDAATVRASVVHRGYPTEERLVVKWGESIVHTEENRFRRYVEQLGPRGVASIRWSAQLKSHTAIAYWSVQPRFGGEPEFLSDFLRRPGTHYQKQRNVIESIFTSVFAPWYRAFVERGKGRPIADLLDEERERARHGADHNPRSLIQHCLAHLWGHRNLDAAKVKIASMRPESPERDPDPVDLLREAWQVSRTEIPWLCPQHGDLHPRNVFVADDEPWIIDFGDVHLGHPMKDLATLEAAVRFTVFYSFEDRFQESIVDAENTLQRFDGAKDVLRKLRVRPFLARRGTAESAEWPQFILDACWCTNVIRTLVEELFSDLDRWQEHYSLMLMLSLLKIAGISQIYEHDLRADEARRVQAYRAASLHAEVCRELLLGSHAAGGRPSTVSEFDAQGKEA